MSAGVEQQSNRRLLGHTAVALFQCLLGTVAAVAFVGQMIAIDVTPGRSIVLLSTTGSDLLVSIRTDRPYGAHVVVTGGDGSFADESWRIVHRSTTRWPSDTLPYVAVNNWYFAQHPSVSPTRHGWSLSVRLPLVYMSLLIAGSLPLISRTHRSWLARVPTRLRVAIVKGRRDSQGFPVTKLRTRS